MVFFYAILWRKITAIQIQNRRNNLADSGGTGLTLPSATHADPRARAYPGRRSQDQRQQPPRSRGGIVRARRVQKYLPTIGFFHRFRRGLRLRPRGLSMVGRTRSGGGAGDEAGGGRSAAAGKRSREREAVDEVLCRPAEGGSVV